MYVRAPFAASLPLGLGLSSLAFVFEDPAVYDLVSHVVVPFAAVPRMPGVFPPLAVDFFVLVSRRAAPFAAVPRIPDVFPSLAVDL